MPFDAAPVLAPLEGRVLLSARRIPERNRAGSPPLIGRLSYAKDGGRHACCRTGTERCAKATPRTAP
jgi:hypothetical protein